MVTKTYISNFLSAIGYKNKFLIRLQCLCDLPRRGLFYEDLKVGVFCDIIIGKTTVFMRTGNCPFNTITCFFSVHK